MVGNGKRAYLMTQFRPGDRVHHNFTGTEWTLTKTYGSYVEMPCFPYIAFAADCTLICGCTTPEERADCNRPCDTVVE